MIDQVLIFVLIPIADGSSYKPHCSDCPLWWYNTVFSPGFCNSGGGGGGGTTGVVLPNRGAYC